MNNPLPRWWMWLFVITVVFAAIYLALYPGLGKFPGTLNWTSVGQYEAEQQRAQQNMAQIFAKFSGKSAEELAKDSAAMGIGERLFGNNCAQCHGSDAKGSKGFPNLTDGDWLYGGSPATIAETITKGRIGVMPPMAAAVGTAEDVRNVANYRAQPVGQRAQQRGGAAGQGEVRGLRRLPRRRRQGQPGAGRPQPDRQDLAARLGRGRDRRDGQRRQDQRHARASPSA